MKENIGGYFELESLINQPYHRKALKLNSARNCLVYLAKSKKIKKIYIPYYLCDSLNVILDYCEVEYYDINAKFLPEFSKKLNNSEYIYIVNYFGQLSNYIIKRLKKIYKNIIIDNVQAFFQLPVQGVDTIYSCRKFVGVPDGAYLYTDITSLERIERDQSKDRFTYILGRLEETPQQYYNMYRENEEVLEKIPLLKMSKSTENILGVFDYGKIKKKRTQNFKYLNGKLNKLNKLNLKNVSGAYSYPLYINNAENLRKKLIDKNIFVPILWPNVIKDNKNSNAYDFAKNILPLPCDQRYGIEEMDKIIKIGKGI